MMRFSLLGVAFSAVAAAVESGYEFVGFSTRSEASAQCKHGTKLAMPKTLLEQKALEAAVTRAIEEQQMSIAWPKNTAWLGGQWNADNKRWEWDDGTPLGEVSWAATQPNAVGDQAMQPYLVLVATEGIHDSELGVLVPWKFAVFCEPLGGLPSSALHNDVPMSRVPKETGELKDGIVSVGGGSTKPFCCMASEEAFGFCGRCAVDARAHSNSFCGTSKANCETCSRHARWCDPSDSTAGDGEVVLDLGAAKLPKGFHSGSEVMLSVAGEKLPAKVVAFAPPVQATSAPITAPTAVEASTSAPTPDQRTPATPACAKGITKGAVTIQGMPFTYLGGENGTVAEDRLTLRHNSGFSVLSKCTADWEADALTQFKLLGKTITFSVDLSRVGCACNLAFYLVSSPARDINGKLSAGQGLDNQPPYYCDANKVGGQWCPEVDIMEANVHAFQSTLHKCDIPSHGHYRHCDRDGCSHNTMTMGDAYGPGLRYTIDTTRPFEVSTGFVEVFGRLAGVTTRLSQEGRQVVLNHTACNSQYLAALSDALTDGMSLRITYWGGQAQTMAWMDSPRCGRSQDCTGAHAGDGVIGRMRVEDGAAFGVNSVGDFAHFMKKVSATESSGQVHSHLAVQAKAFLAFGGLVIVGAAVTLAVPRCTREACGRVRNLRSFAVARAEEENGAELGWPTVASHSVLGGWGRRNRRAEYGFEECFQLAGSAPSGAP